MAHCSLVEAEAECLQESRQAPGMALVEAVVGMAAWGTVLETGSASAGTAAH